MGSKFQRVVYEDNRSTMKVAENVTALKRSKHIDIRHHFLREHIENELIKLVHVSTEDQLADVMTKILGRIKFEKFHDIITSAVELK